MSHRVLFHIGTEKTGTTSIQRFLEVNEQSLEKQSIVYSKMAGRRQNWKLPLLAYQHPGHKDIGDPQQDRQHIEEQRAQLIDLLSQEVIHNTAGTLLFSSELVHSRLRSISDVENFSRGLSLTGITSPEFVIYIREPAETANSLYSTALRAGSTTPLPPNPGQDAYFDNICCHKATVQKWTQVFGKKSVSIRLFRLDRLEKRSVIHDFCMLSGIDTSGLLFPENTNKGLSQLEARLLWRLNHSIPILKDGAPNPLRADLSSFFDGQLGLTRYSMPNELWKRYQEYYADSNEWVRNHFFNEEIELFPSKQSSSDPEPDTTIKSTHSLIDAFGVLVEKIWSNKQSRIVRYERQLRR